MTDRTHYFVVSRAKNGTLYNEDSHHILTEAQCAEFVRGCDAPVSVQSFNPVEGWCRDCSEDIARLVLNAELNDDGIVSKHLGDFVHDHLGCSIKVAA